MELVVVLVVLGVVLTALFLWGRQYVRRGLEADISQALNTAVGPMQQRIEGLETRLTQGLGSVQQTMQQSLGPTIQNIGEQLGRLAESAKQILAVGQDIASLQDLLRPPQVRGAVAEVLLEQLLARVIPGSYRPQYQFKDGRRVDYAIILAPGIVPVDAKFPVDSFLQLQSASSDSERERLRREFHRNIKGHIDSVSQYIRTDEGTLDFALMYVPAESVYYEVVCGGPPGQQNPLLSYMQERRVFAVSPTLLYMYLQTVALGLKGLQVERQAREIVDHLAGLTKQFQAIQNDFDVLGRHIGDTKSKYDKLDRAIGGFRAQLSLSLGPDQGALPPGQPPELPEPQPTFEPDQP
jgi:DNA recombination protein RmuC